jgi:hypothetical protein
MQFDQLKRREFITLLGGTAGARRSRVSVFIPPLKGEGRIAER